MNDNKNGNVTDSSKVQWCPYRNIDVIGKQSIMCFATYWHNQTMHLCNGVVSCAKHHMREIY